MAEVFTAVGVPLNIFQNAGIRDWIRPNVKSGTSLPSVTTLRSLLKTSGQKDQHETINKLADKQVAIMADETIDIKNRKILNILAKPLDPNQKFRLISSKVIPVCNSIEVATQIDSALNVHNISKKDVACFLSDNTPYMILAGQKLQGLCENMVHSTCWAHILHLTSEELRMSMPDADKFISAMKAALIKAPDRRNALFDALEEFGHPAVLPPVPVLTRWATWVRAADYYWQRFDAVLAFINRAEVNSAAMRQLKEMAGNQAMAQQLERLSKISQGLISSILHLENDSYPASSVWLNVEVISQLLHTCGLESTKLSAYLNHKHPALKFWKDVQILDPSKAKQHLQSDNLPESLLRFSRSPVPLHEIIKYRLLTKEGTFSTTHSAVFDFWSSNRKDLPTLSALALTALSVPASTASVERSFSLLKRVFTSLRSSLTDENLEIHLKIAYNLKTDINIDLEIDDDVED